MVDENDAVRYFENYYLDCPWKYQAEKIDGLKELTSEQRQHVKQHVELLIKAAPVPITLDWIESAMQRAIAEWQPTNADYVNMVNHFDERIENLHNAVKPLVTQLKETNKLLNKVLDAQAKKL